jgi:BirA family transcriptional regulator, biotin operon repressor / biotin---[acetyl-CoA-carboxylase] ligase
MVNGDPSCRSQILTLLRQTETPLSGNEIGELLGISRVAVWKHIQQLTLEGYTIDSLRKGYRLQAEPEYLSPSDPRYDPAQVHILQEVESTMLEAETASAPECGVEFWIARRQLKGRGRGSSHWASPQGGLYCTALFRPVLPAAYCALYIVQSGMNIAAFLKDEYQIDAAFCWPNEIRAGGAKLGGLLLEISGQTDKPSRGALGLGLYVSSHPGTEEGNTTCLADSCGGAIPRELFAWLKPILEDSLGAPVPGEICERWENESMEIGESRCFEGRTMLVRRMALNGSLVAENADGNLVEIAPDGRIVGDYRVKGVQEWTRQSSP